MSAKSILEADGKAILNYHLTRAPVIKPTPLPASSTHNPPPKLASLYFAADADIKGVLDQAEVTYPWLLAPGAKFVAKPDQLIKRRGKSGLLALNKPWAEAREWIEARAGKTQKVETVDGVLRQFLVEPFVPHPQDTEYYININSVREVRLFLFFRVYFHGFSFAIEVRAFRARPLRSAASVEQKAFRTYALRRKAAAKVGAEGWLESTRAHCLVLFDGRPDEGKPTPTHFCFMRYARSFHMSILPVFLPFSFCSILLSTGVAAHLTCGYCTLAPIMLQSVADGPALG
jgi:hypothetical protein